MVASVIIRHLLEDPQTLQTAMELEIQQTLSGSRHAADSCPIGVSADLCSAGAP